MNAEVAATMYYIAIPFLGACIKIGHPSTVIMIGDVRINLHKSLGDEKHCA